MRWEHRDMRRPAVVLVALVLSGCAGDTDDSTAKAAMPEGPSTTATEATASPVPPVQSGGAGSRLDCAGGQLSVGTADHAAPPPGATPDQGFRLSPTQLTRDWFNDLVHTPYWAAAGPFTIEQADTKTKAGQRKIRADYRAGDGRLIGSVGVLWEERTGWRQGGWRACAPPAGGEATPVPSAPGLVIYHAMFSPRAEHPRLNCPGNGGNATFDRRSEPPTDPRTVEELADHWEVQQSSRSNPRWNHAAPPRRWYYYPRDPAMATRAVVDWVDGQGRVVMSLELDKWDNSPAWHVVSWNSCGLGGGVV